ncbi:unnamed protein product [Calypogeia fissa]
MEDGDWRELQLRSRSIIDMATASVEDSKCGVGAHMGHHDDKKQNEQMIVEVPIQEHSTKQQWEGGQEQPKKVCYNPEVSQEDKDEEEPFSSPPEQEAGLHTLKQL